MLFPRRASGRRAAGPSRLLAVALALPVAASAQQAQEQRDTTAPTAPVQPPNPAPAGECYGFTFGRWTPPLDLERAGHAAAGAARDPAASNGRDWAVDAGADDASVILFPAWWPAGVSVRLPRTIAGDTVRGVATAFVADGRYVAPTSQVLAWRVPCGRRQPTPPAESASRHGIPARPRSSP